MAYRQRSQGLQKKIPVYMYVHLLFQMLLERHVSEFWKHGLHQWMKRDFRCQQAFYPMFTSLPIQLICAVVHKLLIV